MTYTSDQQLAAMGLKGLADLPNRAGMRVLLRTRFGEDIEATVEVIVVDRLGGTDTILDYAGDYDWSDFIAWRPV